MEHIKTVIVVIIVAVSVIIAGACYHHKTQICDALGGVLVNRIGGLVCVKELT